MKVKGNLNVGGAVRSTSFRGALVWLTDLFTTSLGSDNSRNVTLTHNNNITISWVEAVYDTDNFWNATAPTLFTIPDGVSRVRMSGSSNIENNTTGLRQTLIRNGDNTPFPGMSSDKRAASASGSFDMTSGGGTAIISVSPGDTFIMRVFQNSTVSLELQAVDDTWFAIEVIE